MIFYPVFFNVYTFIWILRRWAAIFVNSDQFCQISSSYISVRGFNKKVEPMHSLRCDLYGKLYKSTPMIWLTIVGFETLIVEQFNTVAKMILLIIFCGCEYRLFWFWFDFCPLRLTTLIPHLNRDWCEYDRSWVIQSLIKFKIQGHFSRGHFYYITFFDFNRAVGAWIPDWLSNYRTFGR